MHIVRRQYANGLYRQMHRLQLPRERRMPRKPCMPTMASPCGERHAVSCRRPRHGSVACGTTRGEICPPVLHPVSCRRPSWRKPTRDRAAVSHVASQISCCGSAAALGGWCPSDHAAVPTQCRPGRGCHGLFQDAAALTPSRIRRNGLQFRRAQQKPGSLCGQGIGGNSGGTAACRDAECRAVPPGHRRPRRANHRAAVARNVMRAGLWPIFAGARRAEKPAAASFCITSASP